MPRKLAGTRRRPTKPAKKHVVTPDPATKARLPPHLGRAPEDFFGSVEPLTQEILQHHTSAASATVAARAEQGRLLAEIRLKIPHGAWGPYIEQKLPYSRGTVDRCIDLHHFRQNHPSLFEQLRPLNLTVALFLIERPVAELKPFLSKPHLVPSLGTTKTPTTMTLPQVMEVLFGEPRGDEDDAERLLRRSRRAGRRAINEIEALIANRDAFDPDDVEDLYDDLLHAIVQLGVVYGLENP